MTENSTVIIKPSRPSNAVFILGQASVWQALLLAIGGLYVIYHGYMFQGFIAIIIAILTGTTRKGIEVETDAQRYRFFTLILGFRIGEWEILPNVQRVIMKYYSDLVTHGKPGRMRTDADQRYIIMFSIPNSTEGVIIHKSYGRQSALDLTYALADFLGVEAKVYDKVV
ncbi:hypothetical protein GCM10011375_36300 [Hymenobacter qilianensis]|uniref:Uncharacterized protein n=2 Tax=Hymenobacter qilianensis TaxID=1385715 RepID=A0ACB5PWD0_9BACT|nr:hypothetical protein [Hymenobacter qilianensis]QNP51143.1 hypothetical protein H9L05_13660 [Hymenobacter qilianensis]GGF77958.1 hypothetical protein GCM10011375_36300 [Hymenobacter qilianensis]